MKPVPPHKDKVNGLDVSHYDEKIDFTKVMGAGFRFCSAKCTEGSGNIDSMYKINKAKAKAAGMIFGGYHFFRPGIDPIRQADHFLRNVDLQPGDFQPMFDWEVSQGKSDVPKARKFIEKVEAACGKQMLIYGPPYMLNDFSLDPWFGERPLWVAHYGVTAPLLPAPWKYWSFWQYSDKGSVPGIPAADEDMDIFNGKLESLMKMVL